MSRASVFLRVVVGLATLLGLVAVVAVQPASAASPCTATAALCSPTATPLPKSLPDGNKPTSLAVASTSCASPSSCVAVGSVKDKSNVFPLLETFKGHKWSASVAPVPSDSAPLGGDIAVTSVLASVSCPAKGSCAAVGTYASANGDFPPLLETLANGTWTVTEGTFPHWGLKASGANPPIAISCVKPFSCLAVDEGWEYDPGQNSEAIEVPLAYQLASGTWKLISVPVLSFISYPDGFGLNAISCPGASVCFAVGSYEDPSSHVVVPVTLTYGAGSWTMEKAPLPANANTTFLGSIPELNAIACADQTDCVAGGIYPDTSGNYDPLFETLQSGKWSASEAPVPSDAATINASADITGISCPAIDACVADGWYWAKPGWPTGIQTNMVLSQQSDGGWVAASGPTSSSANSRPKVSGK